MTAAAPFRPYEGYRTALALPAGLLMAIFLLLAGGNLAGNGSLSSTIAAHALPGWDDGSLLRLMMLLSASGLEPLLSRPTALILIWVTLATLAAATSYGMLRANDWPSWQALSLLGLIVSQGMMLLAITAATPEFLVVLIVGVLIPACRRLEAVGDVQAILNFSLALPLLLLAGPPLAALLPLLVLAVPLREGEARRSARVFAAMLLVAVTPLLIILAGVIVMAARAGIGLHTMVEPFVAAFSPINQPSLQPLLLMLISAPAMLSLVIHLFVPDRRRKVLTTMLALLAPVYLGLGNTVFSWGFSQWLPATAMLGTLLGWLSATRVRPGLRATTLILMLAGVIASWLLAGSWAEPGWLKALLPLRLFWFQIG
ncbi:MAG TPA: hypothetical protein VGB81_00910 [Devosia sp.]